MSERQIDEDREGEREKDFNVSCHSRCRLTTGRTREAYTPRSNYNALPHACELGSNGLFTLTKKRLLARQIVCTFLNPRMSIFIKSVFAQMRLQNVKQLHTCSRLPSLPEKRSLLKSMRGARYNSARVINHIASPIYRYRSIR